MKTAPQGKPTLPLASVLQRESLGDAVSQVTDYCETGKRERQNSSFWSRPVGVTQSGSAMNVTGFTRVEGR